LEHSVSAKKMASFIRSVVGVVVVGILVNLASDAVGRRFPSAKNIMVYLAMLVVAVWLLVIVLQIVKSYLIQGRYAVEALILNSRNELLLYHHPHHKCMLPPGGRIGHFEFPNDALQRRLQERLDLNPRAYRFDDRVHDMRDLNNGWLGEIQRFATPFLVQRELHRQRRFVSFHYDFIYVIRLLDDDTVFDAQKYEPAQFFDLQMLNEMVAQRRTFPDVLDAYKRVLSIVGGQA
jgi:ADP-ribose pyrophosphatase YjhB (NUDIX family)